MDGWMLYELRSGFVWVLWLAYCNTTQRRISYCQSHWSDISSSSSSGSSDSMTDSCSTHGRVGS